MALALGFKGAILGFASETVWGTAVTPTIFVEMNSDSIVVEEDRLHSEAIPGIYTDDDEVSQSLVNASGDAEFEMRYEGMGVLFKHAMGSVDTVEVASFAVITGNKYIDFKEDAGGELTATGTVATYKMGERGHYEIDATNNKINFKEDAGSELTATLSSAEYADAAALAAQIKTQMESAGSGTYTITYSATTCKFTVSVAGGASTFQFLWKTGTNGADGTDTAPHDELGFLDTLDGIDAASDVSDYSTIDPSGTLCAHLKTILEAAGAGTYTVTFSNSTKKITIAVAGGAAAVQFLWKTGTHGSDNTDDHMGTLLGFDDTADGANGASDISDNVIVTVFDSTYKLTDDLPTGITFAVDRDTSAFIVEGGKIDSLSLSNDVGGWMMGTIGIVGEDMTNGAVTAATLPTSPLVTFAQGAISHGSAIPVTSWSFTLSNNLKTDRRFIGSRLISEPKRSGKIEVTGTMTAEFDSVSEYDDFRAATEREITMTYTGGDIKTGFTYTMTITFPITILTSGNPTISDEGAIMIELPFKAYATDSSTREFNIVLRNAKSLIS